MSNNADKVALFNFIRIGDLAGVKAICTTYEGFDVRCHDPHSGETVLQCTVATLIPKPSLKKEMFAIAEWFVQHGADPKQVGVNGTKPTNHQYHYSKDYQEIDKDAELTFTTSGQSTLSLIANVKKDVTALKRRAPWEHVLTNLTGMLDLIVQGAPRVPSGNVNVGQHVQDMWDKVLADKDSHDLVLECADGDASAHAHVLAAASPVIGAMLSSGMNETVSRRIKVDCAVAVVEFLLELVYTGAASKPYAVAIGLPALELAHRWSLKGVVKMLGRASANALSVETFAEIAEAAVLYNLESLKSECKTYAIQHPTVMNKVKDMPASVREWLDAKLPTQSPTKKQRFSF
mmetsp:Transcript_30527/g.55752  ORF Transcript_30527/g.55752 Transcript_30527/m.55752 type:complete len:347 (+) Transcript_30527:10-1050(+)